MRTAYCRFGGFVLIIAVALVTLCRSVETFGQYPKSLSLDEVRNNWQQIEDDVKNCSGLVSAGARGNSTLPSDSPVSNRFEIRGALAKKIDSLNAKSKEEIVWLWAKSGSYVLRKPKDGKWSIAQSSKPNSKLSEAPFSQSLRSVSILGARMLYLTNSPDFSIKRLEKISEVEAIIEIDFPKTLASVIDGKKINPDLLDQPVFDKAKVVLDPQKRFRIKTCSLLRAYNGARGRTEIELTYGHPDYGDIPSHATLSFGSEDGKTTNRTLVTEFSEIKFSAQPESEFTLEHYGLMTPKSDSNSWWPLIASIVGAVMFLGLAIRFFRRR